MHIFNQSIRDQNFVQDPYPFYDRARDLADVVWWEDFKMPAAMSHRAVRMLLSSRDLGREPLKTPVCPAHIAEWQANETNSMLELEPPSSQPTSWIGSASFYRP